jgi:dTMP kinase
MKETHEMPARPIRWYGDSVKDGIPYLHDLEIRGRLIVIEGPDASGRSTQIELITANLEANGYAVLNTGLKRSELISRGILEAKRNTSLGKRTLALYYAADFADQLEHKIIPALQAGYVVLSDRYIYTLMARNTVRGIPRSWSHDLYSFAMVPDMVFYIDVDPYKLVHRVFQKHRSLDHYESGADMALSDDMFESFIMYQKKMAKEFEIMRDKYGLRHIDGQLEIERVDEMLQRRINAFLDKYG